MSYLFLIFVFLISILSAKDIVLSVTVYQILDDIIYTPTAEYREGVSVDSSKVRCAFGWNTKYYEEGREFTCTINEGKSVLTVSFQDAAVMSGLFLYLDNEGNIHKVRKYTKVERQDPLFSVEVYQGTKTITSVKSNITEDQKQHWINTRTGVGHNSDCQFFNNTQNGKFGRSTEGKQCQRCD
jgi:hypothetical protein